MIVSRRTDAVATRLPLSKSLFASAALIALIAAPSESWAQVQLIPTPGAKTTQKSCPFFVASSTEMEKSSLVPNELKRQTLSKDPHKIDSSSALFHDLI